MRSKTGLFLKISLCLVLIAALSFNIVHMVQAKKSVPFDEPEVRPDIRADATWDGELGLYVSSEIVKNEEGEYVIAPEILDAEERPDYEAEWLATHTDSEDPVDKAILYSLDLIAKEPVNPLSSAIVPQLSDAIVTAAKTIPVEKLPELWEKCCEEPAYRAQKLTAMEVFTGLSFKLGLYDPWAQEQWFIRFSNLVKKLPLGEITKKDADTYSNLLLPLLADKFEAGTISEDELVILEELVKGINTAFDLDETSDIGNWLKVNASWTEALRSLPGTEFSWE